MKRPTCARVVEQFGRSVVELVVRAFTPKAWLIVLTAAFAVSCFGYSLKRLDAYTVVENLGANRYTYRTTQLLQEAPRGPAAPAMTVPSGAQEVGQIEVVVEYGGAGGDGLRDRESDFYPTLSKIAGEMGGTNFIVLRSGRETRPIMGDWITSLTVDVVTVPSPM